MTLDTSGASRPHSPDKLLPDRLPEALPPPPGIFARKAALRDLRDAWTSSDLELGAKALSTGLHPGYFTLEQAAFDTGAFRLQGSEGENLANRLMRTAISEGREEWAALIEESDRKRKGWVAQEVRDKRAGIDLPMAASLAAKEGRGALCAHLMLNYPWLFHAGGALDNPLGAAVGAGKLETVRCILGQIERYEDSFPKGYSPDLLSAPRGAVPQGESWAEARTRRLDEAAAGVREAKERIESGFQGAGGTLRSAVALCLPELEAAQARLAARAKLWSGRGREPFDDSEPQASEPRAEEGDALAAVAKELGLGPDARMADIVSALHGEVKALREDLGAAGREMAELRARAEPGAASRADELRADPDMDMDKLSHRRQGASRALACGRELRASRRSDGSGHGRAGFQLIQHPVDDQRLRGRLVGWTREPGVEVDPALFERLAIHGGPVVAPHRHAKLDAGDLRDRARERLLALRPRSALAILLAFELGHGDLDVHPHELAAAHRPHAGGPDGRDERRKEKAESAQAHGQDAEGGHFQRHVALGILACTAHLVDLVAEPRNILVHLPSRGAEPAPTLSQRGAMSQPCLWRHCS